MIPNPYVVRSSRTCVAKNLLDFPLPKCYNIFLAEENSVEKLIDKVLSATGFTDTDKLKVRRSITYKTLFTALIVKEHLFEVAEYLELTSDIVEKLTSRHLKPLFPEKDKNTKWDNFLLSLIEYKKCSKCKVCKTYDEFAESASTWDNKSYTCKSCKAVYRKDFTEANPEYNKTTYREHKAEYITRSIQYKTRRTLATPPWADLEKIKEVYRTCPEGYHVDHIVPLQGEYVSGLHVECNLQHLPALENLQKHNKFIE